MPFQHPRAALRLLVVLIVAFALVLGSFAVAAADPINENTTTFTATCTGLGEATGVAVLFPSPNARGGTSAFQVVGTNIVLVLFTPGTDRLANEADTSCLITSVNGEPTEFEVAAFIIGSPVLTWDPALDWRDFPDEMNPSPDSYGNSDVWSYRASTSFLHVPATYQLLPNYSAIGEQWNDPGFVNLFVAHGGPSIVMHSYGGRIIASGRTRSLLGRAPSTHG